MNELECGGKEGGAFPGTLPQGVEALLSENGEREATPWKHNEPLDQAAPGGKPL